MVGKKKISAMKKETVERGGGPGRGASRAGPFLALLLRLGPEQRLRGQHGLTDTSLHSYCSCTGATGKGGWPKVSYPLRIAIGPPPAPRNLREVL